MSPPPLQIKTLKEKCLQRRWRYFAGRALYTKTQTPYSLTIGLLQRIGIAVSNSVPPTPQQGARTIDLVGQRLRAVSFLDIVGYSTLMAENAALTHRKWARLLNEVVRPAAEKHQGRIVKLTGDGALAEFPRALDAVTWACEVQVSLQKLHAGPDAAEDPLAVRIAIHLDEVILADGDMFGSGVNIASRLQEYAEPGGIVLSETVYSLVKDSLNWPTRDLGPLYLKNIPDPVAARALDPAERPIVRQFRHTTTLPSIAVLTLQNLGGDPADDYFVEGVVEDIIVSLASLRELLVIARGTTLTLARRQADLRSIGKMLGVRYVMTGNVRRSRTRLRVAVQLHDAESGVSLWGDTAEGALDDLFEMQDRIVGRVVAGIAPHVRNAEWRRALRKRPENFTAYDTTLQALQCIHSMERDAFFRARSLLERAMSEDPNFAMPVAWAARWRSLRIGQNWCVDPRAEREIAAQLAARAIELDGQNALALATYGHVRSYLFHEYDVALGYFDRALSACPNSAIAWFLSSGTLSYVGRTAEAVEHAEHAVRLSPFDQSLFQFLMFLGMAHYANGNYEEAVKAGRRSMSERPAYTSNLRMLSASLAACGRQDEAIEVGRQLLALEPGFNLKEYERKLLPFRDATIRALYLDHLRKACLPA